MANTIEFTILLFLYIVVIVFKLALTIYLGKKVLSKTKREGKFEFDFLFSVFFLILCLLASRILLTYFDFFMTEFNSDLYYIPPNVEVWKIANFLSNMGFVIVLFIIDKRGLNFKLKGCLAYLVFGIQLIALFYPINSKEDFEFVSSFGLIQIPIAIIIPLLFLYIGIKADDLRRTSFLIFIGIVIYSFGTIFVSENILSSLIEIFGPQIQVIIYFLFALTKIIGLTLLSYASTKFYI